MDRIGVPHNNEVMNLVQSEGGVNNDLSEPTGERCEPTSNKIRSNEIRPDTPGLRSHQPGSGKSRNYIIRNKIPCGSNKTVTNL
jgi:hypothetical protein